MTTVKVPVRLLRHCPKWQKSTAKARRTAGVEQGPDLSSEDEDEGHSDSETGEQDNGYQSSDLTGSEMHSTWSHGQPSEEHPTQSRLQPQSRSGTISHQQSL